MLKPRKSPMGLFVHRWAERSMLIVSLFTTLSFLAGGGVYLAVYASDQHQRQGILYLLFLGLVLSLLLLGGVVVWRTKRAVRRFQWVRTLMADGREREAIPILRQLIIDRRLPHLRDLLHFLLGRALQLVGETEEAKEMYRATALWPAWNNLAALLLAADETAEGIQAYHQAIALAPDEPYLYTQLAQAYEHLGESVYARKTLEACLKANPHHQGTRRNLQRLDRGEPIQPEDAQPRFRLNLGL